MPHTSRKKHKVKVKDTSAGQFSSPPKVDDIDTKINEKEEATQTTGTNPISSMPQPEDANLPEKVADEPIEEHL